MKNYDVFREAANHAFCHLFTSGASKQMSHGLSQNGKYCSSGGDSYGSSGRVLFGFIRLRLAFRFSNPHLQRRFYRSTVADQNGFWAIHDILVNRNFSDFCLEHIDYKNIGSSTTCLKIPPVAGNIVKKTSFSLRQLVSRGHRLGQEATESSLGIRCRVQLSLSTWTTVRRIK